MQIISVSAFWLQSGIPLNALYTLPWDLRHRWGFESSDVVLLQQELETFELTPFSPFSYQAKPTPLPPHCRCHCQTDPGDSVPDVDGPCCAHRLLWCRWAQGKERQMQMLLMHLRFHVTPFLFISLDWGLERELLAKLFSLAKTNSNVLDCNPSYT